MSVIDGGTPYSPDGVAAIDGGGPVVDCTEARFYFGPVKADLLSGEAGWTSTLFSEASAAAVY